MPTPEQRREAEHLDSGDQRRLAPALFWIGVGVGVTAIGATLAYVLFRVTAAERRDDPTTQRIQELIDEANSLLKALDERNSA